MRFYSSVTSLYFPSFLARLPGENGCAPLSPRARNISCFGRRRASDAQRRPARNEPPYTGDASSRPPVMYTDAASSPGKSRAPPAAKAIVRQRAMIASDQIG